VAAFKYIHEPVATLKWLLHLASFQIRAQFGQSTWLQFTLILS